MLIKFLPKLQSNKLASCGDLSPQILHHALFIKSSKLNFVQDLHKYHLQKDWKQTGEQSQTILWRKGWDVIFSYKNGDKFPVTVFTIQKAEFAHKIYKMN